MAWTFETGLLIGLLYSVFVAIYMGMTALRMNNKWADACDRLNREWQEFAARIVVENYRRHVIEGQ